MHNIANFIMSRRIIPVILVLTAASFFIAFKSQGSSGEDDPVKARYEKTLRNVGLLLEEGHYQPKKINDAFGQEVFKEYIEDLDQDKKVFLASDITELGDFATRIDDEIHGKDLISFFAINKIYSERQAETNTIYRSLLAKPFDFSINEQLVLDPEKTTFPKTQKDRIDIWRKYLKYLVLDKFVSSQNGRELDKGKPNTKYKADSTLEREARAAILMQMDRFYTTTKNRETSDYNFGKFVNTITQVMDPHSNYFPPIDLRSFNESMSGSFYGIGAQLKEEDGKIKIASLVTGMPAWTSKEVKEGEIIEKVAQADNHPVDVTGFALEDAVKLIRGEKGTIVKLTMRTLEGTEKVVAIKRGKIELEGTFAQSAVIDGQNKIGYLYLPEFYANFDDAKGHRSAADVAVEIKKLKADNVSAIVIDLRGNGGGSLWDVVQIAGYFIGNGPVVQVKTRDGNPQVLNDKNNGVLWDGPLAVMVDETSASASEIFAAAIQDYHRGIIIGSTSTYGKGTVQRNIPLNPETSRSLFGGTPKDTVDLGTVKLTLQKFYRINGDATQMKGVVPDVILPDRLEYLKIREKDNTNALNYDEIKKANYTTWTSTASTNPIITQANFDANANPTFKQINNEARTLEKGMDKAYPLDIVTYKKELEEKKNAIKKLEVLYKLPKELKVENLTSNAEDIKKSKENMDRNKQFISRIANDIYIDETVKILDKVISQTNVAKAN